MKKVSVTTSHKNFSIMDENFLIEKLQFILKDEHIKFMSWGTKVYFHRGVWRKIQSLYRKINRETI